MAATYYVGRSLCKLQKVHASVRLAHTLITESEEQLKREVRNYCDKYKYGLGALQSHCIIGHYPEDSSTNCNEDDIKLPEDYSLFQYSEPFCQTKVWDFIWITKGDTALGTYSKTMFWKGYEILEKYAENEPLTSLENTALSALSRFFFEKVRHEERLTSLRSKRLSETGVASLLAQHFLSQLLPHPSNFYLDKHSKGKTDSCPCGCGGLMKYGLTSIGSPELFHGSADIVLFPSRRKIFVSKDDISAAVFTVNRSKLYESYGHGRDDWCLDYDSFEEGIATGECMNDVLDSANFERQLLKQAISLSLCKQKTLRNGQKCDTAEKATKKSSCIVPVCGISSTTYDIAMYDAENDYLLKMYEDESDIFDGDGLIFSTIIDIWMVIYHELFCLGPSEEKQEKVRGTCRLVNTIGPDRHGSILENSHCLYRIDAPAQRRITKPSLKLMDVLEGNV